MKIRSDVMRVYQDVHGWVGICSGLALFIAFYAGALTMFADTVQLWASPPPALHPPPTLERTPELIAKVLRAHPEAAPDYRIHIDTGPQQPARMSWSIGDAEHGPADTAYASLDEHGALQIVRHGPSHVADMIDVLHQQVGLPLPHELAMPIMGTVALLYGVALISGVVLLLPRLIRDLFALRLGTNLKRMWLDVHNLLGLFSLPFHIVMALSSVVFAFHDEFYAAQRAVAPVQAPISRPAASPVPAGDILPPATIVARLRDQAPGFQPMTLRYRNGPRGASVRVEGRDPRFPMREATFGIATLDARSGAITSSDYLPGHQSTAFMVVSSFFALHFGNFGGALVQWSYFFLGLGGAFLFYTGNLLWIESRRRRERASGAVQQSRSTRILAALTVGVCLGCVAGVSATIGMAKILPAVTDRAASWHEPIYYAVFTAMVGWALARGAARSGPALLLATAAACWTIPASSVGAWVGLGWNHGGATVLVDVVAVLGGGIALLLARQAARRARARPRDSVWSLAGQSA